VGPECYVAEDDGGLGNEIGVIVLRRLVQKGVNHDEVEGVDSAASGIGHAS
jgi:hypothetical protein